MSPQNGGDLCANGRVGQAHTDLFAPSTIHILLVTTELGRRHRVSSYHQTRRGSASVAVRVKKRANKNNVKIRLLFSGTETGKQNTSAEKVFYLFK